MVIDKKLCKSPNYTLISKHKEIKKILQPVLQEVGGDTPYQLSSPLLNHRIDGVIETKAFHPIPDLSKYTCENPHPFVLQNILNVSLCPCMTIKTWV